VCEQQDTIIKWGGTWDAFSTNGWRDNDYTWTTYWDFLF